METHNWLFERIRFVRNFRKIKSVEMAKCLEMSQSNYSKLENGNLGNYYIYLPAIAIVLRVKLDDLLKYETSSSNFKDTFILNFIINDSKQDEHS